MSLVDKLKGVKRIHAILLGLALIMIVVTIHQIYEQSQIYTYRKVTTGKIIKYAFMNMKRYELEYEYYVQGRRYTNQIETSYFKCNDGNKGCINKEFPVLYSEKNPEYSMIKLGKYEKFRRTVEFINLN